MALDCHALFYTCVLSRNSILLALSNEKNQATVWFHWDGSYYLYRSNIKNLWHWNVHHSTFWVTWSILDTEWFGIEHYLHMKKKYFSIYNQGLVNQSIRLYLVPFNSELVYSSGRHLRESRVQPISDQNRVFTWIID